MAQWHTHTHTHRLTHTDTHIDPKNDTFLSNFFLCSPFAKKKFSSEKFLHPKKLPFLFGFVRPVFRALVFCFCFVFPPPHLTPPLKKKNPWKTPSHEANSVRCDICAVTPNSPPGEDSDQQPAVGREGNSLDLDPEGGGGGGHLSGKYNLPPFFLWGGAVQSFNALNLGGLAVPLLSLKVLRQSCVSGVFFRGGGRSLLSFGASKHTGCPRSCPPPLGTCWPSISHGMLGLLRGLTASVSGFCFQSLSGAELTLCVVHCPPNPNPSPFHPSSLPSPHSSSPPLPPPQTKRTSAWPADRHHFAISKGSTASDEMQGRAREGMALKGVSVSVSLSVSVC